MGDNPQENQIEPGINQQGIEVDSLENTLGRNSQI